VLGPAILVAFRLGAYARAAWALLFAAGEPLPSGTDAAASPLQRYCAALKLLLRSQILSGVRVRRLALQIAAELAQMAVERSE
jgi:hypothetical protein